MQIHPRAFFLTAREMLDQAAVLLIARRKDKGSDFDNGTYSRGGRRGREDTWIDFANGTAFKRRLVDLR